MLLGTSLMAVCAVFYVASGRWLARLFTDDPEVAALAGTLVSIAGIYQVSDVIQSVSLGALRGLLDNRVPMLANAVCYWGLSLPTVWFLTFRCGWGAAGVWAGYLPWMVATGLFFLVRFLRLTARRSPAPADSTPWPRT
jgi:MATE family multidrug resistance protein